MVKIWNFKLISGNYMQFCISCLFYVPFSLSGCFTDLKTGLLKVIAENLSTEEIKGLKETFNNIDTDGSGTITYEELRDGLSRLGSKLTEAEIKQLMDAVRTNQPSYFLY